MPKPRPKKKTVKKRRDKAKPSTRKAGAKPSIQLAPAITPTGPVVRLPYKYEPRAYQVPLLRAMDSGYKRAVAVWHRRAGKDKTLINLLVKKAFERVGCYYYYFPTKAQGRKTIWDGIDRDGMPFLEHIPPEIIEKKNDQEMKVKFKNGSLFQVLGTDFAEVVGPNPVGCVFSEYSLQNPEAWNFVQPILAENDGWAVFNYTPRGMNHGYDMFQRSQDNEDWFSEVLTIDDTHAITHEAVKKAKDGGMSEELAQQEFYCSWEWGLSGAYYLKQIAVARRDGRICELPVIDAPGHTAWDLGIRDATSIWFWQNDGPLWRNIIDYYEKSGEGLAHYVSILKTKGYEYGDHFAPHDADRRGAFSGESLVDRAKNELGFNFNVLPREPTIDPGIEAVRVIFQNCRFDKEKCKPGLQALMNYQKTWDEKHRVFSLKPLHNWASNGADAFRYFARATRGFQESEIEVDKSKWRTPHYRHQEHGQGWMA